jgi:WD40 repeat protein
LSDDGLYTDPVLVLDPGRHTAAIIRLDADREGRFLVTASHDKTVRVWAASDGRLLSTIRLPAGPGNVGKAYAAAISPDGTIVAAGGWTLIGDNDIYLFNRASGRLRHRVGGLPDVVLHLSFSQDGSRLAATLGSGGVRLIDPASGRVVAEDTDYGGQSYGAAFDEAGRLATTSYDGKLRLYDPALRLLRTVPAPGGRQPFGLAFSQGGKRLAVGYENGIRVDVLDGATMQHLLTPDSKGVDNGDLGRVAWSADGANLYAAGRWLPANGRRLRRWPEGGRGAPVDVALSRNTVMSLRPLPEGRLAFAAGDPRLGVLGGDGRERWSLGPAGADFRDQLRTLAVSADGVLVRFGYEYGGRSPALLRLTERRLVPEGSAEGLAAARVEAPGLAVEGWEDGFEPTLNGKPLALDAYEVARSLAIAPDGQRFVLGSEWSLRLFDRAGEEVWRQDVPGTVWTVAVSADGRLVVAAYADGTIRWHRLGDGEELLAFYPDGDRERWVLWTPKGYYDASPGAEDLIGWQVNRDRDEAPEFFTASRFRDQFHRPDVIDFVLKELDVDQAVARCSQAASVHQPMQHPPVGTKAVLPSLPPTVSIVDPLDGVTSEDEELVLSYLVETPPDDPPRALQVIVNGRTILRQLRVSSGPPARRLIVELPSDEATVTLIAENGAGAGDAASILVRRGGRRSPRAVIKPRLHVLAVGVSAYSETSWNLRYAAQDAEDVAMRLLREQDGLYREVRPNYLIDKEAKRRNIS